jgi:DNA (cytosine-5)-methyltransferase 1
MNKKITVIDLFAGPGGLGEGFASFQNSRKYSPFKIRLSIEKDYYAHQTLELRSFFRQFGRNEIPSEYYKYLRGYLRREELFSKYPRQAEKARSETWLAELGETSEEEIDKRVHQAIGKSDAWLLIGGPPCQAYSFVGRSKIRGEDKKKHTNNYEKDHRHYLYLEYLRILAVHQPPIFVMENVKGILSSEIRGENIFKHMLWDLKLPVGAVKNFRFPKSRIRRILEYRIFSLVKPVEDPSSLTDSDFVIRSEDYGIPQSRHRVILLGVRSDLQAIPEILRVGPKRMLSDAISDLPRIRSRFSKEPDSAGEWCNVLKSLKSESWFQRQPEKLQQVISGFIQRLDAELPFGEEFIRGKYFKKRISFEKKWFFDSNLCGYCNHVSRGHIRQDLKRYFFAGCFAKIYGRSPKITDFPKDLYPKHRNIYVQSPEEIIFDDRFRVQLPDAPSTTVVSHISKDGHYFIHPDPLQCRSLTVREAARLQTFPDNYLFEGPRTEQYNQVGNAVPPLLAKQIAELVYRVFKSVDH